MGTQRRRYLGSFALSYNIFFLYRNCVSFTCKWWVDPEDCGVSVSDFRQLTARLSAKSNRSLSKGGSEQVSIDGIVVCQLKETLHFICLNLNWMLHSGNRLGLAVHLA